MTAPGKLGPANGEVAGGPPALPSEPRVNLGENVSPQNRISSLEVAPL